KLVKLISRAVSAKQVRQKPFLQKLHQPPFCDRLPAFFASSAVGLKGIISINCLCEVLDTLTFGSYRLYDRRVPHIRPMSEAEQRFQLLLCSQNAFTIGLVDNENVADLHYSRLDGLDVITHTRYK